MRLLQSQTACRSGAQIFSEGFQRAVQCAYTARAVRRLHGSGCHFRTSVLTVTTKVVAWHPYGVAAIVPISLNRE